MIDPIPLMREIFSALAILLPLSLDPNGFRDVEQKPALEEALQSLAKNAGALEAHGGERGAGFQYLAGNLARDAEEAQRRFAAGETAESAFFVQQLTENCLACHARLPSGDAPLGQQLFTRMDLDGLAPPDRARLLAATRQFSAALDTWEILFRMPDVSPAQMEMMGWLADYLTVAIRVNGDFDRALGTLRLLALRNDVPEWVGHDVRVWIDTLEAIRVRGLEKVDGTSLDAARKLIAQGEKVREHPADHTGMVHDLVASGILHRYTESHPYQRGGADLAEAYFLLGSAESRIDRSYWFDPADFYLETSIRMAPGGPFARQAYSELESRTVRSYSGTSGTHLPDDERSRLDELSTLIRAAESKPN
jgi:hypothetical protein